MTDQWAELDDAGWRIYAGLHRMLLRLAGQLPDELIARTRTMLGSSDLAHLPDTVSGATAQLGIPLLPAEAELLRNTLTALGTPGEPAGSDRVRTAVESATTKQRFTPVRPELMATAGDRIPAQLDLTSGPPEALDDLADDLTDLADDLVVDALTEQGGVAAIHHTWRAIPGPAPAAARRVFLVEVAPGVRAWELALVAHRELIAVGEEHPQVEVYWTGDDLPPYHRSALANSVLLHRSSC